MVIVFVERVREKLVTPFTDVELESVYDESRITVMR